MKLVSMKKVEGCLEGANAYDFHFDSPIDKAFCDYIGAWGKYIYNDSFDKPFFKVMVKGYYTIKGSVGNKTFRVLLPETPFQEILDEIEENLKHYNG